MNIRFRMGLLFIVGFLPLASPAWLQGREPPPPDAPRLLAQLQGEHCDYHLTLDGCTAMDEWWFLVRDGASGCRAVLEDPENIREAIERLRNGDNPG